MDAEQTAACANQALHDLPCSQALTVLLMTIPVSLTALWWRLRLRLESRGV